MKKKIIAAIIAILVLLVVVLGITAIKGKGKTEAPEITGEMVQEKLSAIGEFNTAQYDYTRCATAEKDAKIFKKKIKIGGAKVIYQMDGRIKVGFDFTQAEIKVKEKNDKKIINITLPAPKITSSEIFEDTFKVFEEKNGLFKKLKYEDYMASTAEFKETAEKAAVEKGIYDMAKENAITMIDGLLSSLQSDEEYELNVEFAKK